MMSKVGGFFAGLRDFFVEVKLELAKCAWPTRPELVESTVVVAVSVALLAIFVGLCDVVLVNLLKWLAPS